MHHFLHLAAWFVGVDAHSATQAFAVFDLPLVSAVFLCSSPITPNKLAFLALTVYLGLDLLLEPFFCLVFFTRGLPCALAWDQRVSQKLDEAIVLDKQVVEDFGPAHPLMTIWNAQF